MQAAKGLAWHVKIGEYFFMNGVMRRVKAAENNHRIFCGVVSDFFHLGPFLPGPKFIYKGDPSLHFSGNFFNHSSNDIVGMVNVCHV